MFVMITKDLLQQRPDDDRLGRLSLSHLFSTIHLEVPRGVVLGDYVIEYGDEFEDVASNEGSWWTSCIFYKMFDNIRNARNRRRARMSESRRSSYDSSNSDDSSVASVEFLEYRLDEIDDEFITTTSGVNRSSSVHQRSDSSTLDTSSYTIGVA